MDSERWRRWKTRGSLSRRLQTAIAIALFLSGNVSGPFFIEVAGLQSRPRGSVKQSCASNHLRKMGTFKGKMEPPRKPEKFANLWDYPWQLFCGCGIFACLIPHFSVLRVALFLGRVDTVPPEEKEKNCEAHGPAFEYNAATGPHVREKKTVQKSATVKREVGLVPWWKSYVYVSLKQVKTWIPT